GAASGRPPSPGGGALALSPLLIDPPHPDPLPVRTGRGRRNRSETFTPPPALRADPPPQGRVKEKHQCPNPKFSFPTRSLPPRCRSSRIAASRSISSPISARTRTDR